MPVNLTPHALLFTVAAIGISETAYLIRKRIAAERPVCPIGEGCLTVLTSKYNRVLGIHNDVLGMIFYIVITAIASFLVIGLGGTIIWVSLAKIALLGGTMMSLVLIYIQWKVVKAWCFWCLMSSATVFLMDIIILTGYLT